MSSFYCKSFLPYLTNDIMMNIMLYSSPDISMSPSIVPLEIISEASEYPNGVMNFNISALSLMLAIIFTK